MNNTFMLCFWTFSLFVNLILLFYQLKTGSGRIYFSIVYIGICLAFGVPRFLTWIHGR